ncbi:MAG: hypothetical protein JWM15_2925 [Cryptosporangiaceae bacterium]|nr:hypothetical protein [Cryptosporangiaceae bacterium]
MTRRGLEVQVWLIDVDGVPPLPRAAVGLLGAADERAQLAGLRDARARWSCAVGRVVVRRALARVVGGEAGGVRLTADARGRATPSAGGADVNLSRSGPVRRGAAVTVTVLDGTGLVA